MRPDSCHQATILAQDTPPVTQITSMNCFDDPNDVFAELNEEEALSGLQAQDMEEQEPEWEALLPSADDEARFASLFEVDEESVPSEEQNTAAEISLPLTFHVEEAEVADLEDEVKATWDPYVEGGSDPDSNKEVVSTPFRQPRIHDSMGHDLEQHCESPTTPPPKRVRLTRKTPQKVTSQVLNIDASTVTMADLHVLIKKHVGCEKSRDWFMQIERPKVRVKSPSWNSSATTSHLRIEWSKLGVDGQKEWLCKQLGSQHGVQPREFDCKNYYFIQHQRALAAENNMMESQKTALRRCACMGTWNGTWLEDDHEYIAFLQTVSSNEDIDIEKLLQLMCFRSLLARFEAFLLERTKKLGYCKWSFVFELSVKSDDLGRFHIHAYWHTHKDSDTKPFVGTVGGWSFEGSKPLLKPNSTQGKYYQQAVDRGHYYCQCLKIGRLYGKTNHPKYEEFLVQQKWVIQLWQRRKLNHAGAKVEIVNARGHTASYLREIELIEQLELKIQIDIEKAIIDAMLAKAFKPSRFLEEVALWQLQYSREGPFSLWGVASRFKFLVLTGPSSLGKTQFAKKLFGEHATLTVGCQNVSIPFLKDFIRGKHKAIIFDEISSPCIHNNKAIFQANNDIVLLGQTPSAEYIYRVFLYGVAMVCCCNDWMEGITRGSAAEEWLLTNSIVYDCTTKMWED